ncbi:MAG TPA: hypothetical protein VJA17_00490 [Candidatus Omnitrophota bacterium]|nr:hypothetical protein [Candidatus Omnitrophota bacterium]
MRKEQLGSKLAEIIFSLEEIISKSSKQTSNRSELIKCTKELKRLARQLNRDKEIDWCLVIAMMFKVAITCLLFSSK